MLFNMERSNGQSLAAEQTMIATTAETAVFAHDQMYQNELDEARTELAGAHAERSRRLIEGSTSAENIRQSSEEVADYIQGLATERYFELTEQEGKSHEEAVVQIDSFIAEQTHQLLSGMTAMRTQNVAAHNRFVPSKIAQLYDKALETWRSWEVPAGDGALVSRLLETDTWQHLEKKSEGSSRRAKIGRFALLAVKSSINGIENLKYSGARKRLAAMAGLGMVAGAAAGAFLGVAGAGAAGVVAGSMAARATIRSGVSMKLSHDSNIDNIALYDQVRMTGRIDQITDGAYSVEDVLSYVESESKTMLHQNNLKLLSGVAIGVAGGLLGNSVARGMGWFAGQYIDSQFNAVAHADTGDVIRPDHVVDGTADMHTIVNGSNAVEMNHVISGANRLDRVVSGRTTYELSPNHVVSGSEYDASKTMNHVVDGSAKRPMMNHVVGGSDSWNASHDSVNGGKHPKSAEWRFGKDELRISLGEGWYETFREMGISPKHNAELLKEVGPQLHDKGLAYWDSSADEWRMNMTENGKMPRSAVKLIAETANEHGWHSDYSKFFDAADVDTSADTSSISEHDVAEYAEGTDEEVISKGEGGLKFANEMGIKGTSNQYAVWNDVAPKFESQGLTYQMPDGEWRLYMTPNGDMPIEMIQAMAESAQNQGISSNYDSLFSSAAESSNGAGSADVDTSSSTDNEPKIYDTNTDPTSVDNTPELSSDSGLIAPNFTISEFGSNPTEATEAYYDAFNELDIDDTQANKLLNMVAYEFQDIKGSDGVALAYKTSDGVWHFRETAELPQEAKDVLASVADKYNWTTAS